MCTGRAGRALCKQNNFLNVSKIRSESYEETLSGTQPRTQDTPTHRDDLANSSARNRIGRGSGRSGRGPLDGPHFAHRNNRKAQPKAAPPQIFEHPHNFLFRVTPSKKRKLRGRKETETTNHAKCIYQSGPKRARQCNGRSRQGSQVCRSKRKDGVASHRGAAAERAGLRISYPLVLFRHTFTESGRRNVFDAHTIPRASACP